MEKNFYILLVLFLVQCSNTSKTSIFLKDDFECFEVRGADRHVFKTRNGTLIYVPDSTIKENDSIIIKIKEDFSSINPVVRKSIFDDVDFSVFEIYFENFQNKETELSKPILIETTNPIENDIQYCLFKDSLEIVHVINRSSEVINYPMFCLLNHFDGECSPYVSLLQNECGGDTVKFIALYSKSLISTREVAKRVDSCCISGVFETYLMNTELKLKEIDDLVVDFLSQSKKNELDYLKSLRKNSKSQDQIQNLNELIFQRDSIYNGWVSIFKSFSDEGKGFIDSEISGSCDYLRSSLEYGSLFKVKDSGIYIAPR